MSGIWNFGVVPIIEVDEVAGVNPIVVVLLSDFSAADPDFFVLKTSSAQLSTDVSVLGFVIDAAKLHAARRTERRSVEPRSLQSSQIK